MDAGFLRRPALEMLPSSNFPATGNFDVSTSKSPLKLDTYFTTAPDRGHSLGRSEYYSTRTIVGPRLHTGKGIAQSETRPRRT